MEKRKKGSKGKGGREEGGNICIYAVINNGRKEERKQRKGWKKGSKEKEGKKERKEAKKRKEGRKEYMYIYLLYIQIHVCTRVKA